MSFAQSTQTELGSQPALPSAMLQALLNCAPVGLAAFGADGRMLLSNEAAQRMLGLGPHTASGLPVEELSSSRFLSREQQTQLTKLVEGQLAGPLQVESNVGLQLLVTRSTGEDGCVFLSIAVAQPDNEGAGRNDPLTGLADRRTFLDRLTARCAAPDRAVAVIMIDLDHFKAINDTLGHSAGDALLKLVAQRLRGMLRKADLVSRLGADEFAIIMEAGPELPAITARLVSVLTRPYLVERHPAVIGASIGVAIGPQHGATPTELIRAADIALHRAKADGRGAVRVFDPELGETYRNRHALADDLRRAIPLQQLEVYFQPQVCLRSRMLSGFEALVRWNHPQRGMVSPDQFITLAEEIGLILPLGEWVLHEACRLASGWPEHLTIAVNVSPLQLLDRDRLPRIIAATLARTGLQAHRLEIEVTESALVREAEALSVLTEIRAMGVKVSMDDFGTGYSSLSQLRRFPFDKLKIDRSFVRDLGGNDEAAAVVRAIAALGKSLGMTTIAEGVETAEQEALCRADGCSAMQGYLISRPVPAAEIDALIQTLS